MCFCTILDSAGVPDFFQVLFKYLHTRARYKMWTLLHPVIQFKRGFSTIQFHKQGGNIHTLLSSHFRNQAHPATGAGESDTLCRNGE